MPETILKRQEFAAFFQVVDKFLLFHFLVFFSFSLFFVLVTEAVLSVILFPIKSPAASVVF